MFQPRLRRTAGSALVFALEFELWPDTPRTWNEWWGSLWLWAEGRLVGNPRESEMISIGLESLQEAAGETGSRASSFLPARSPQEALEMVILARYGVSDPRMEKTIENPERLFPFEILPRRTGPFFDNWEAILIEEGLKERFIYRQEGTSIAEAVWPLGTFRAVVNEGAHEFEKITRSMLGGAKSVS